MKAPFNLPCLALLALALLPSPAHADEPSTARTQSRQTLLESNALALAPDDMDANIAVWTSRAVQEYQFTQHPFDAEISGRFLDRYLEGLDYYHLFFLQSDLQEFESYRSNLQVYTLERHDISPAYTIFSRFLERAAEREAFETNLLQTEHFEFGAHERFTLDRHDLPNPKDMAEATNLWRQEVRLEYLNEKLAQKIDYFGPVDLQPQDNLVVSLTRKSTNAYKFEFLPRKFQDDQGRQFGQLDVADNDATNATVRLHFPTGGNLLKITNHFFDDARRDLGLIRFERAANTNDGEAAAANPPADAAPGKPLKNGTIILRSDGRELAAPPVEPSAGQYECVIELKTNDTARILRSLQKRYVQILKNYHQLTNDGHVLESYLTALARAYDPHSDYFGRAEADNFKIRMQLSLIGIGARLTKTDSDKCQIDSLIPGGPADLDHRLKSKDLIVAVAQKDQEPVPVDGLPLEEVVEKIRGPEGTPVTLTIERESLVRPLVITLIRNKVKLVEDESKATLFDAPPKIGVIDVPSFYAADSDSDDPSPGAPHERKTVTTDVAALVKRLKKENVQGIILDLRTNGGGYLDEAIKLTGLFTGKGPVVQTKSPDGIIVTEDSTNATPLYDGPLMVLTSRMSASASEILAGALQDYGRAVIVGDKATFGKGTVQWVQPLTNFIPRLRSAPNMNLGSLHLTIKKFYRASGLTTESNGVASDIVLPSILNYANFSESSQPNWLPADTVSSAEPPNLNLVKPYLPELLKRSLARREKSKDWAYLQEDIDEFRKRQEDKSLSLKEAERLQEQHTNEARLEARKKERAARPKEDEKFYDLTLKNIDQPLELHKPAPKPALDENADPAAADADQDDPAADDFVLTEARRIMADYISLVNKPRPGPTNHLWFDGVEDRTTPPR